MELKKLNIVYNVTDTSENGWTTQGQVVIESDGVLTISFSTRSQIEPDYIHIGGANYSVSKEGTINSSFSCTKQYLSTYRDYTEQLVEQILEHLKEVE